MFHLMVKYPECFVKYEPFMVCGNIRGITYAGEEDMERDDVEKRLDIKRAKKAGCRGAVEICAYLNGEL